MAYQDAISEFNTVTAQVEKSRITSEINIIHAEEALAEVQKTLDDLDGGLGVELLETNLAEARTTLAEAGTGLAELTEPDAAEVESKRKQIVLARANLGQAEADLTSLLEPDRLDVAHKEFQIALTEAALGKVGADLIAGDALEVALLEAEITFAQTALEGAIERLEGSTLVSPWDGFVSTLHVEKGQEINATTAIIELVDPSVVKVDGVVDEIDVLSIQPGARASVTMDALPNDVLDGRVANISSAASNQQGVVTFEVDIEVTVPEGLRLQEGLSALANVTLGSETGLLIPVQAITGTFDDPRVLVINGGGVEERSVTLGSSDGFWTIVQGGLVEGDEVVMEVDGTSARQVGFRGVGGGGNFRPPGR